MNGYNEAPAISGAFGEAWLIRMGPPGTRGSVDVDAALAGWIVRAPHAHPLWRYWMLSVVHLRPLEGGKPPQLRFPEATHEIVIVALNPEHPLPPLDHAPGWPVHYLTPIDVCEQMVVPNDAVAVEIAGLCVRAICDGASPDQDHRRWWAHTIGATAAHYREGRHGAVQ